MNTKRKPKHFPSGYWLVASRSQRGVTVLLVVGFMGIFMLILGTITSFAMQQAKYGRALYDREQALHSAEAGLEYYRWFLAHNPNNLTNGTGLPGPYAYLVNDPEGGNLGSASISVSGATQCSQIQWIDITSVGKSNLNPSFPRTLFARYMRPSVGAYSYLLNSNVWAGADRNITGPYFSNGGIRMDGTNNSDVSSAVATWSCDSSFGCSPTQTKNGVWGAGTGSALWSYPIASIDFAAIAANFTTLKGYAQNNGGRFFDTPSGSTSQRGYHIIFKSDGTFDVYRVTSTTATASYSSQYGWTSAEYSIIATQVFVGNYSIPSSCSLVYIQDRVWVEGVVSGKVTVIAADTVHSGVVPDAYLSGNITYATNDGNAGLTVIAEGSVLIPLNSPDTMEIHGIFVAQSGHYGRNFYTSNSAYSPYTVPSAYNSYVLRTQLTTNGSVVSNARTGTSWSSGGATISGYQSRVDAYDELQATAPPPFTPSASTDYRFVIWREQ
ncbi:hypothetical protein HY968_05030 [Candidatus Kaiserbacteria bacterium]|nr:hypothetical protein [Candidatus Kaiserbacteria bacterium]